MSSSAAMNALQDPKTIKHHQDTMSMIQGHNMDMAHTLLRNHHFDEYQTSTSQKS